jgi:hypothetical protein
MAHGDTETIKKKRRWLLVQSLMDVSDEEAKVLIHVKKGKPKDVAHRTAQTWGRMEENHRRDRVANYQKEKEK